MVSKISIPYRIINLARLIMRGELSDVAKIITISEFLGNGFTYYNYNVNSISRQQASDRIDKTL